MNDLHEINNTGVSVAGRTVRRVEHPDLIDLDTGDEYEWVGDGYAHEGDHDSSWPRSALESDGTRLAEIPSLPADRLTELRQRYAAGD